MTCDECKTPIERGDAYSLSEFGRFHSRCLRTVANPHSFINGRLVNAGDHLERISPLFVLQRL